MKIFMYYIPKKEACKRGNSVGLIGEQGGWSFVISAKKYIISLVFLEDPLERRSISTHEKNIQLVSLGYVKKMISFRSD